MPPALPGGINADYAFPRISPSLGAKICSDPLVAGKPDYQVATGGVYGWGILEHKKQAMNFRGFIAAQSK